MLTRVCVMMSKLKVQTTNYERLALLKVFVLVPIIRGCVGYNIILLLFITIIYCGQHSRVYDYYYY